MKPMTILACALLLSACASTREPTMCELAAKYPETRDPIVASMFGLPTAGCNHDGR